MDISLLNPASGANQPYKSPSTPAHTDPSPAPAPHTDQAVSAPVQTSHDAEDLQMQYEAAIRQAALSFKDTYAVSDTEFTIFKDANGTYITRYISLRDGSVTYVPQPALLRHMQETGGGAQLMLNV